MATLSFTKSNGQAIRGPATYKFQDDNVVRLVGGILPRYVYWVKGTNGKPIPLECLAFDREAEAFGSGEPDHVRDFWPELKCQWAYAMLCIDRSDGAVKVINLKKKLFQQIKEAAEGLGDPTDPMTGWDVHFKRKKTGPLNFNVEYTLSHFKLKPAPLSQEDMAAVAEAKPIDEQMPRPTPEDIRKLCEKIVRGEAEDGGEEATSGAAEAASDLN